MTSVAVVGGGLAGLTVAEALLARGGPGLDLTVFERQARAGGLVRSERTDGFLYEHGPAGFLDHAPATLALVERLGLTGRLLPSRDLARRRYVFRAGKLRALPSSPASLLSSGVLPAAGLLRLMAEPLVRTSPAGEDETIHAFARRRFGRHAAEVLADVVASGIFGGDARALSMRSCFPDVAAMEREHGSVMRGMAARRRAAGPSGSRGPARLTSFPDGLGELVAALADRLGARLRLATAVERIERADGRFVLALDGGGSAMADAVVVTCDLPAARRMLAADRDLTALLAAVPWAPMVTVALGYPASSLERPLDGFGLLAPRQAGLRVLGALWESSIFDHRAPPGHVLVRAMLGGATDPDAGSLDDGALVDLVRADLRTAMGLAAPPVLARVVRIRPGLPQFVVGHAARLEAIDRALAARPGLHLGGHGLRGVGVNALIEDASHLAARLAGAAATPLPA